MLRTPLFLLVALLASDGLLANAQTALIQTGDSIPGVGNVLELGELCANDAGSWITCAHTDHADPDANEVILSDSGVLLREGQMLAEPQGATVAGFSSLNLNNRGQHVWILELSGTQPADTSGIYFGTQLVRKKLDLAVGSDFVPGTHYVDFFEAQHTDENRIVALVSMNAPGGGPFQALVGIQLAPDGSVLSESLVLRSGDRAPQVTRPVLALGQDRTRLGINDVGDILYWVQLSGGSDGDLAVVYDQRVVAQEQTPCPVIPFNWGNLQLSGVALNDNGDYLVRGKVGGEPASRHILLAKNDEKLVQKGDHLPQVPAPLTWIAPSLRIANSGEAVWFGEITLPGSNRVAAIFIDHVALAREGVTQIGGSPIEHLYRGQAFDISPNGRYLDFRARLANGKSGVYRFDRGQRAHQELRNGSNTNPRCLTAPDPPIIGTLWPALIDSRVVDGADLVVLFAHSSSLDALSTPFGELLVDVGSPQVTLQGQQANGIETLTVAIPPNPSFIGAFGHAQAMILANGNFTLCNAVHPTAGL